MSLSPRDRTIIGVAALVAVVAAAWLLVIQPKRSELSNLKRQVSTQQSALATAQSTLASGQSARAQFRSSYATMVKLGEAVPTDDNVGSLIYQLQSAANGARVDFRALSVSGSSSSSSSSSASGSAAQGQAPLPPGVTAGPAGFPVEPFSFTFRGSFFHLANFFARLQRFVTATDRGVVVHGRLLTLNSINLGPGAGGFPQIDASVSATAFLLPSSQGLTAGATPLGPVTGAIAPGTGSPSGQATPGAQPAPGAPTAPGTPAAPAPRAAGSTGSSVPPTAAVVGGQP